MSVFSMTGFGTSVVSLYADNIEHSLRISVRSVNHRHLDIKTRIGRELMALEPLVASKVREVLQRGHVEVIVETESHDGNRERTLLNRSLARELYSQGTSLAEELGVEAPSLSEFMRFPGVITTQRLSLPLVNHQADILKGLDEALKSLVSMRAAEGVTLRTDLEMRLERLLTFVATLESALPQIVLEQQQRLTERVAALLADSSALDPQRMEFEVALLADKCDVSEEVTRIRGHLMQFRKELMREPSGSGKKLAFVTQELNREFNTIGSKIGNPELISMVIDAKSELEKVREQVANLE